MKVKFKTGESIIVQFEHFQGEKIRETYCHISEWDDLNKEKNLISEGRSKCNKLDSFNKNFARKLSLRRALENTHYTKEERKQIWFIYNNEVSSKYKWKWQEESEVAM
jgi:hypothetical protein